MMSKEANSTERALKLAKAWFERNTYGDEAVDVYEALCEALAQERSSDEQPAQQEPVAWMYPDDHERMLTNETFCTVYSVEVGSATRGESTVALYTSPPAQRTWVGLTDEERKEIWKGCDPTHAGYVTALVEAKLKEKNA